MEEALQKASFGKFAFPVSCRQDKQGHKRHKDEDFMLTVPRKNCLVPQAGQEVSDPAQKLHSLKYFSFKKVKFFFVPKHHRGSVGIMIMW